MKKILISTTFLMLLTIAGFSQNGNWRQMQNSATDITVGADGSIWIIGTDRQEGGFGIYKWNGRNWSRADGAAEKIAIDRNGNPWVINSRLEIYQRQGNSWRQLPGEANEIAAGADGSMWIVGNDQVDGGYGIYKWNGRDWSRINNISGEKIAVDRSGNAWIVRSDGSIYQRNRNSWNQMPGAATEISTGADGSIWITGTDRQNNGYGVYRWDGRDWSRMDGEAVKVVADRSGNVWGINARQQILQGSANSGGYQGNGGSWRQLPGKATDIAAGADGSMWITGTDRMEGGYGIYKWDGRDWRQTDGAGERIMVDRSGNPWVINSDGEIYQRRNNVWSLMPGSASDISAGADGSIWIIGSDRDNRNYGGNGVYQLRGRNWTQVENIDANRIAVDRSGNVWAINPDGAIYQKRRNSWNKMPGEAREITAGADGSVWIIGMDRQAEGYGIYKWNGSDWSKSDGAGRKIAVDRSGKPWVINDSGNIYVRN